MTYLLDTHALLWWLFDSSRLSKGARALIAERSHKVLVSSASAWEIATKHRLGKLPEAKVLVQDISGWLERAGFSELPISVVHAQRAGTWTQAHKDPFDRMLAAQSMEECVPVIGNDDALRSFGVQLLW